MLLAFGRTPLGIIGSQQNVIDLFAQIVAVQSGNDSGHDQINRPVEKLFKLGLVKAGEADAFGMIITRPSGSLIVSPKPKAHSMAARKVFMVP